MSKQVYKSLVCLQASTHAQTKGHGRVHVNIALADEFNLSETYLLSSKTINRKLPISCKSRSGKYGFQPLLIFFRLVIGKTHVYWTNLIIKTVCKKIAAVTDLVSLRRGLRLTIATQLRLSTLPLDIILNGDTFFSTKLKQICTSFLWYFLLSP